METVQHSDSMAREASRFRPFLVRDDGPRQRYFDNQPSVPLLPATLLQVDLLLSQRAFDVQTAAEVVHSDVGATLQVFRGSSALTGSQRQAGYGIADCIIRLGPRKLRLALTPKASMGMLRGNAGAVSLWQRARLTAEIARILSRRFAGINPADAFLAGLLHEVGRIPALLSWQAEGIDLGDTGRVGRVLAQEWRLPSFVEPTLQFTGGPVRGWPPLRRVVSTACDLANAAMNGSSRPRRILPSCQGDSSSANAMETPIELGPMRVP